MVSRYREIPRALISGEYHNVPLEISSINIASIGTRIQCWDTVGEQIFTSDGKVHRKDNPFDLIRTTVQPGILSGKLESGGTLVKEFINFPVERQLEPPPSDNPAFGGWDPVAVAARVAQVTNPSTPHLGVPQAIGELKDFVGLPGNLREMMRSFVKIHRRHSGRPQAILSAFKEYLTQKGHKAFSKSIDRHIKSAANWNLLTQFVVKPMVGDFLKMLEVRRQSVHNWRVLKHLKEGKALKRRALLGKHSLEDAPSTVYLQTEGAVVTAVCTTSYMLEEWATVRWQLLNPDVFFPETGSALLKRARKLALGLTTHQALQASWALLPWTWLTDWFADVGSLIEKHDNSIPARIEAINYMRKTYSQRSYELVDAPEWVKVERLPFETEERKRRYPIPAFVASLPYVPGWRPLSGRQWSILGSLVAQRVIK